jgi:D-serine deaminase-like pyridoxal phosphate-dependent protein
MHINEIDTPAVVIDVDILGRNLQAMAKYCATHNLSLRPHTKTHKMIQVARLQLKYGARGITVAKLGEAEVMADAGIGDIVVVYPLWGESKWNRLAELARRTRISVTMDSLEVAEGISRAAKEANVEVGIRLEFDTGFHRCGLPLDMGSLDKARRIMTLPNLRWEGISVYWGHIMGTKATREHEIPAESLQLDRLYRLLDAADIPYPIVSGGNTPAAFESHRFHGVTEIRPGTYVFNDRNTVDAEAAAYSDCAAAVLTTVVSAGATGRAIIDAGSKTLTADPLESGQQRHHGCIQGHPHLVLEGLSEEHGHVKVTNSSSITVGERLRVIPNHICPCINLHDSVYIVSGETVVDQWKVAARGRVA